MKLITTLIFCLYSTISQAEIYNFTKIYLDTTGSQSVDQVIDSNESVVMECESLIKDYFYFSSPFKATLVKNKRTNTQRVFFNYSERRSTTNGQFGQIGLPVLSQPTPEIGNSTSGGLNRYYGSSDILDIFALEELRISEYTERQKSNRKGDLYRLVKFDKVSNSPLSFCLGSENCVSVRNPKIRSNVLQLWCNKK